ncbi:hypothetical protein LOD99_15063 [Oopsacas minuta]|uniref:Uncharacterized protein n=1 Tax=Oopsacas minuta TaxID=111878 RepID=A0AAV7KCZ5_9METZ|nr:hypothetical protein LOD99_15063 [Oopsacas minuta]
MSNSEKAFSTIAREFISKYNLGESNCDLFRRKFSNIKSERKIYLKEKDLATWEELLFCRDPQMDDIPQSSNGARPFKESTVVFEEDFSRVSRKHISELSNKSMRYRLANLRLHLETVAHWEEVSLKMISSYLLLLYSQEEHDVSIAKITKIAIAGSHGLVNLNRKLSLYLSCFLLDSLEIGKSKYIDVISILINEDIILPDYNRVAIHHSQICLIDEMESGKRVSGKHSHFPSQITHSHSE